MEWKSPQGGLGRCGVGVRILVGVEGGSSGVWDLPRRGGSGRPSSGLERGGGFPLLNHKNFVTSLLKCWF